MIKWENAPSNIVHIHLMDDASEEEEEPFQEGSDTNPR